MGVVDATAREMHPTGGEAVFDGHERHVQVDDSVHVANAFQRLGLGHCPREAWQGRVREAPKRGSSHGCIPLPPPLHPCYRTLLA